MKGYLNVCGMRNLKIQGNKSDQDAHLHLKWFSLRT